MSYISYTTYKGKGVTPDSQVVTTDDNTSIKAKLTDEDMPQFCAHFDSCSVNKCPLDPSISKRNSDPADPICDMPKSRRHNYWLKMSPSQQALLPYQGYFEGEFRRKQAHNAKWAAMSESERQVVLEKLAKLRQRRGILRATATESANNTTQDAPPHSSYQNEANV